MNRGLKPPRPSGGGHPIRPTREVMIVLLLRNDMPQTSTSPTIYNVRDSNFINHSPGATIKNNFNVRNPEFVDFVRNIKSVIQELNLAKAEIDQIHADVQTIEVQIESPAPKYTIISESANSIRSILEGIAANTVTSGLLFALDHYFPK
jgi:hypothetical protein